MFNCYLLLSVPVRQALQKCPNEMKTTPSLPLKNFEKHTERCTFAPGLERALAGLVRVLAGLKGVKGGFHWEGYFAASRGNNCYIAREQNRQVLSGWHIGI